MPPWPTFWATRLPTVCGSWSVILAPPRPPFRAGSRDLKASGLLKEGLLSYYEEMYQGDLPEQIYDYCETHQVAVVTEYSEEYPPGLRELSSPPAVLYRKGTFPSWKRTLGVVGSRKATAYGLENARSFARYLAGQGVTVVSGGAFGIDAAAHQGALDGGGCTVAVLAGGFQHLYPAAHSRLFGQIAQHGALVTEYAPWVEPLQKRFSPAQPACGRAVQRGAGGGGCPEKRGHDYRPAGRRGKPGRVCHSRADPLGHQQGYPSADSGRGAAGGWAGAAAPGSVSPVCGPCQKRNRTFAI